MRALVAGAQALVREGLKRVTLQIEGTCEFIETADVAKARAALHGTPPFDIAWFDKALFTADEIARLRRDQPRLRLLTLSEQERAPQSAQLLVAGISVLVPKSASTDILAVALRLAMAGNVCVRGNSPAHPPTTFTDWTAPGLRRGTGPLDLTARQYEVLGLLAQRCSNKAIAPELGIGVRTAKGHVSVFLRALHADNRADAGRNTRRWLARAAPVRTSPALA